MTSHHFHGSLEAKGFLKQAMWIRWPKKNQRQQSGGGTVRGTRLKLETLVLKIGKLEDTVHGLYAHTSWPSSPPPTTCTFNASHACYIILSEAYGRHVRCG